MGDQKKYASKLEGTRILAIGGSSGIGFSVAEAATESGATVIISSSNKDRVDAAVKDIQSSYPSKKSQIAGYTCNLGDESNLESNLKGLLDSATDGGKKKLDHIAWTAADPLAVVPLEKLTIETIKGAGTLRFFGPLLLGKLAPQYLNPGPSSSIVFTTGAVSEKPIPQWTLINSYATGLHGMTRGMALDLAPVRVNLVSPGAVDTALWRMQQKDKEAFFKQIESSLTTGKVATPDQIAESYLYLFRDSNISGSVISTNGGHLIK